MTRDDFGTERVSRILLHLAPPVMLAQLIQALYNIVDSFFVGRYSDAGLTALSIIYPLQLLMIALGVGTGVGLNTLMARQLGLGEDTQLPVSAQLVGPAFKDRQLLTFARALERGFADTATGAPALSVAPDFAGKGGEL